MVQTILIHWNCFLSSVVIDEKDGHGLKLFKFNAKQQSAMLFIKKIAVGSKHVTDYTLFTSIRRN